MSYMHIKSKSKLHSTCHIRNNMFAILLLMKLFIKNVRRIIEINIIWESISFILWILEPLTSSKLNHAQVEENLSIRTQMHSHIRTNTYMCTRICHYSKRIFQQVINTSSWIWYSIDTRNLVMSTTQKSRLLF